MNTTPSKSAPIFLLCVTLGLSACGNRAQSDTSTGDIYALQTPYHTETEWIIGSVCRNAYEMLSFIADKKGEVITPEEISVEQVKGDTTSYDVTLHAKAGTVTAILTWPGSIWSSQAYVPFCKAALAQLKLTPKPGDGTAQGNPLATLLDFSEQAIQGENLRVSSWLTAEPDNALAHQQAALVLGTLAMKENSGWFWDPRGMCNRVAAHLAVARSLAPGVDLTTEGKLAECEVGLIADTKKECADELDQLDKMAGAPKELAAWVRAGRMRNSRDWRLIDQPEIGSGFEQVEYFRAVGEAVDVDQSVRWLKEKSIPDRQDWTRLVLEEGFSVDDGQIYALPAVKSELALMRSIFVDRFQSDSLVADLNEAPGDALGTNAAGRPNLRVIDSGMWAQYFQRHLCHAVVETGKFLAVLWGVPEQAAQFDRAVDHSFAGLTLYPYLQHVNAVLRGLPEHSKAILAAFVQHPEWSQAYLSSVASSTSDPEVDLNQYRAAFSGWFSPPILTGTAYDPFSRMDNIASGLKAHPAAIDHLYAIAPLQYKIAELELTTRYGDHPNTAQVKEILGDMPNYYLGALDWETNAPDLAAADRIALEQKAAGIDPSRYWSLAKDFISLHRDGDAADAYQQFHDKDPDRVTVSNYMDWLVNYYYDHGQQDKAMAIAKEGAEVYSSGGLQTMMNLLVRLGKLDEAEDIGKQIKERYNEAGPLTGFYDKQIAQGKTEYRAKLDSLSQAQFPSGKKAVTLASFTGAPTDGIQFNSTTDSMTQNGINTGQVIVACDGIQVENVAQYTLVRDSTDSPSMTLIIWDGHAYSEVKVNLPGRRFGTGMHDFKP